MQAYGGWPKSRGRCDFDRWVASAKTHRGAMKAFKEFERCFTRLPEREQRLVGVDKVQLFVKSIDQMERMAIGLELDDDNGSNGLIEDWSRVERVCRQLDREWSGPFLVATRPMNCQTRMTRDDAPSQQETGAMGSRMHLHLCTSTRSYLRV